MSWNKKTSQAECCSEGRSPAFPPVHVPRLTAVRAASGASAFGISAREAKHLRLNRDSAGSSEKETNDPERDRCARACAQHRAVADSRLMEIVHVIIICDHASFRGKERSALIVGHSLFSVTHGWCGGHENNETVQHPCAGCYWLPSLFTFRDVLGWWLYNAAFQTAFIAHISKRGKVDFAALFVKMREDTINVQSRGQLWVQQDRT